MERHNEKIAKSIKMDSSQIIEELTKLKNDNKSLFLTSSFQTQSLPLLHIISQLDFKIPVFYLNTGFLFPETLSFIDELRDLLSLDIRSLSSDISKINQIDKNGNFLFSTDPDYCCHINKVKPLESTIAQYDIWISGVRADQNFNRSTLKTFEESLNGKMRFHPMLSWTSRDIYLYIERHKIPKHPLESQGYVSVGCEPCTRKPSIDNNERSGRWHGLTKTECGLHTELIKK